MNRDRLAVRNTAASIFFSVLNFALGIVELKLFLDAYGDAVNGLIQTGSQALSYLALIESGICAAFLFHLYKPIAENRYDAVSSLYKGFGRSMRTVVLLMLGGALLISVILPLGIQDKSVSFQSSILILALISLRYIAPYYFSLAPKYMIIAREKRYKAEILDGIQLALVYAINIAVLVFFRPEVHLLLTSNALVVIGIGLAYRRTMRREYKGLLTEDAVADMTPTKMTGNLMAHNVSGLAFNNSSGIILSVFTPSLSAAFIYASYNKIAANIVQTVQRIVEGTSASIGIKVSRNDRNVYNVYRQIHSGTMAVASVVSIVFIVCMNAFVELWIGRAYVLSDLNVLLFGLAMYANIMLPAYYVARNARGLFRESRNFTIAQAVVNIFVAVALVKPLGITAILLGILVGRYGIAIPMNYRLIYQEVFPSEKPRWRELITGPAMVAASALLINEVLKLLLPTGLSLIMALIVKAGISTILAGCLVFAYMLATDRWLMTLLNRFFKNTKWLTGRLQALNVLIRKYNLCAIFYYAAFIAGSIWYYTISTTHLYQAVNIGGNSLLYLCVFLLGAVFLMQGNTLKSFLGGCALGFIAAISWYKSGNVTMLLLALFLLASRKIRLNTVVKIDLILRVFVIALVALLSTTGVIDNYTILRSASGQVRYSLGFVHPNAFATNLLCIYASVVYLLKARRIWKDLLWKLGLATILIVLCITVSDSRTSAVVIIAMAVMLIASRNGQGGLFTNRFVRLLCCWSVVAFTLFMVYVTVTPSFGGILGELNKLVTGRFVHNRDVYEVYKFSLLGQDMSGLVSVREAAETGARALVLDNAYLMLGMQYGMLIVVLWNVLHVMGLRKLFRMRNYTAIILVMGWLLYALVETPAISVFYNVPLLFLGYVFRKNKKGEKTHEARLPV